jgi:hypothetical protein
MSKFSAPLGGRIIAVFGWVFGICVALWTEPAHAQNAANSAAAQALFDAAREEMKKGNYAEACPKFEESQRLDPGSGTLLNLGICYEQRGLTASAWATFLEAAMSARAAGKLDRVKSAQQRAEALAPRLSRLTIRVADERIAGLEVRRDDVIVRPGQWGAAIPTDPGTHLISAKAPGRKAWQVSITLREKTGETVSIPALEPSTTAGATTPVQSSVSSAVNTSSLSEATSSTRGLGAQRIVAVTAAGLGVAGVVVGSIYGLKSKSARDESQVYCDGGACDNQEGFDALIRARSAGNVSTVAFIAGAAGLTAGAILWFTAPSQVRVGLGPAHLRIEGSW